MTATKKEETTRRPLSEGELERRRAVKIQNRQVILDRIIEALSKEPDSAGRAPGEGWNLTRYAEAGETSRGTLYNQFGSLDGLLTAIHEATRDSVQMVDPIDPNLRGEDRIEEQTRMWLKWIDNNRSAVLSVVFKEKGTAETKAIRLTAKSNLNRRVILEHLGVEDPSTDLLYAAGVYLGAAEDALRGYLVVGRDRAELGAILERLLRNVIELGRDRADVPKPLPGDS